MKVKKEVEFSKELLEASEAMESLMVKYAEEKKKGTAAGPAMMNALTGSITHLLAGFDGIQNAGKEFEEDLGASINAMTVPLTRGVCALVGK